MPAAKTCFAIEAEIDPQASLRVLALFAQRSLTPARIAAATSDRSIHLVIEQSGLTEHVASILAAKIGEIDLVHAVGCEHSDEDIASPC